MFFLSGISGKVGGAAARQLLEEGRTVRALVRDPHKADDWSQKGVDVRRGDFNDADAVAGAMEEVEGAYLMLPPLLAPAPGFPEAKAIIASFREALRQVPPPRLVVLSSIGSQQSSGLGLITTTHLMEEALKDLPFPTAFVRAGKVTPAQVLRAGEKSLRRYLITGAIVFRRLLKQDTHASKQTNYLTGVQKTSERISAQSSL